MLKILLVVLILLCRQAFEKQELFRYGLRTTYDYRLDVYVYVLIFNIKYLDIADTVFYCCTVSKLLVAILV